LRRSIFIGEVAGVYYLFCREAHIAPTLTPTARLNLSASAPNSSTISSGSITVVKRFAHLAALLVAHEPVYVDVFKGLFTHALIAHIIILATQKIIMSYAVTAHWWIEVFKIRRFVGPPRVENGQARC
jgi:hypothetical protein